MKKNKKKSFKRNIFLCTISILGVFLLFYFLNGKFKSIRDFEKNQKLIEASLKAQEKRYQEDIYGDKDPLKTYQMFLEALKKEDIDLAVKYFIFEKQEEYRKLLESIKKNNNWEEMLKDLLRPENQKGVYLTDDWYKIEVLNDKREVVTVISLIKPKNSQFQEISPLWKIAEF